MKLKIQENSQKFQKQRFQSKKKYKIIENIMLI
jgi:hypothetical protein